ncbi:FAD-dependent oxidoreductase [Agrobacterium vitis]
MGILGMSVGLGSVTMRRQSAATGLPAFAYEAEAQAWFTVVDARLTAAGQAALTRREKVNYNYFFRRLKSEGVYSAGKSYFAFNALWISDARTKLIAYVDMLNPSRIATEVGTMTVTANRGLTPSTSASYINTNCPGNITGDANSVCFISLIDKTDLETLTATTSSVVGVLNSSTSGFSISPFNTSASNTFARGNSASSVAMNGFGATNGAGFYAINRVNSTQYSGFRNGEAQNTVSAAAGTLPTGNFFVGAVNNNGTPTTSATGFRHAGFGVWTGLTAEQVRRVYKVCRTLHDSLCHGLLDFYDAGTAPDAVTADVVVYGMTPGAITAAIEAKRQGRSVVIVGGWRDFTGTLGGVVANGLGFTDYDQPSGICGLSKYFLARVQAKNGKTTNYFEPRHAFYAFKEMLDPNRLNGQDIPVYFSTGVIQVTKSGTRITKIKTLDGRGFSAKVFIDGSYEGDLMARSGVSYIVGREASGTGAESANGWRGTSTSSGELSHQLNVSGTLVSVDPFVTQGDENSGLIHGVLAWDASRAGGSPDYTKYRDLTAFETTTGQPQTQAFTFRMTMTTNATYKATMSWNTAAPTNYVSSDHEVLYRYMEACTAASLTPVYASNTTNGITKADDLGSGGAFDMNSQNGYSLDLWGGSWNYVEANYADRETIWTSHRLRWESISYAHRYETRILSSVRSSALSYFVHNEHYLDHHPNDPVHHPCQLYVREGRRMLAPFILTGNDLQAADGSALRSNKTIGLSSYAMDSHHMSQRVHPTTKKIWNEGGFFIEGPGGSDKLSPLPLEIIMPSSSECTNLLVTFPVSVTHVAFGNVRMEFTHMMLGQAAGMLAALSVEQGNIDVQSVPYDGDATSTKNLRYRLLNNAAANSSNGETVPQLPQVA